MSSSCTKLNVDVSSCDLIDIYKLPSGEQMTFYHVSNNAKNPIWVHCSKTERKIPLQLAEVESQDGGDTWVEQCRKFLHDVRYRPEYHRVENVVRFSPVHAADKIWYLQPNTLKLPRNDTPLAYRSNGCITYLNGDNKLVTWDWENSQEWEENIAGDIITNNQDKNGPIVEIVTVGCSYFAFRFKNNSALITNLGGEKFRHQFEQVEGIRSFRNRYFVLLRDHKVVTFVDVRENGSIREVDSPIQSEHSIYVISDTLFAMNDDRLFAWEEGKLWRRLNEDNYTFVWDSLLPVEYKALAYLYPGEWKELTSHAREWAPWGISSTVLLSDGSVMNAKAPPCASVISIITLKGVLFSTGEFTVEKGEQGDDWNGEVCSFKELSNGSVAIKLETRSRDVEVRIITPRIKPSEDIVEESLKLQTKLNDNPGDFDLYHRLAKHYLSFDHISAYHTYLDGLEKSAKDGKLHQAKKFYDKAKNIFANREEPMELFLSYLMDRLNRRKIIGKIATIDHVRLDISELIKDKKCKRRLFIGECDFTYTESLINKHRKTHRQLARAIVATEFSIIENKIDPELVNQRVETLRKKGVVIYFGIDGTTIHKHEAFRGLRFKRIQWNNPFGICSNSQEREEFRQVIPAFFQACKELQLPGDRVHVTLGQGWNTEYWYQYKLYENPIVRGSLQAGYRLIRKRRFGKERYPGYIHKMSTHEYYVAPGVRREFVFEKAPSSEINIEQIEKKLSRVEVSKGLRMENSDKIYYIKKNNKRNLGPSNFDERLAEYYFECSTDDDSSDYYTDSD